MRSHDLARALADAAETLAKQSSEALTLAEVCELAVELIEVCDHASITMRTPRSKSYTTVATSSPTAQEYDDLQHGIGEGPSVDSATDEPMVRSNDIAADPRWPRWAPAAAELGARSMVSVALRADGKKMGSINLYSHRLRAWDDDALEVALLYAAHSAIALQYSHVAAGLHTALASRHQIGVAQGILMERHGLSVAQSFSVLQRHSSHSNTKLSQVAADLVGELDAEFIAPPAD